MEYKILESFDTDELEYKANDLLKDGWELYGQLVTRHNGYVYQTMIKREKNEQNPT